MNTDKIALIVGGSSGIGLATAQKLLDQGTCVWIIASRIESIESAKKSLQYAKPEQLITTQANLYDNHQVQALIECIEQESKHIEYLVNAAGYFKPVSFLDHKDEDYDMQMEMNRAFFFITQAVAKNMKHHGGGSIVNVGSMWAHQAVKATPSSAYSMQKSGLHALTQHLAMELAEFGIRANAVAPAVVLSSIYKSFIKEQDIPETLSGFNTFHPIGRIGQPDDVAHTIMFLLSNEAAWTTGTVLNVDGGVMAGRNQ